MNIISKRTLVQFYEKHPQAKTPLEVWHQDVKKVEWKTPDDIKRVYFFNYFNLFFYKNFY